MPRKKLAIIMGKQIIGRITLVLDHGEIENISPKIYKTTKNGKLLTLIKYMSPIVMPYARNIYTIYDNILN